MYKNKILNGFEEYLVLKGYSEYTPSGHPSTTYDYSHIRIPYVLDVEKIDIIELAVNIKYYISKYDIGGSKEREGMKSHRAVINALKRFDE